MLPYYKDIQKFFDYDTDNLLNFDYHTIIPSSPEDNLFLKNTFTRDSLDYNFRNDLEDTIEAKISKINLWYWGSVKLNVAHIDCGKTLEEIHPFAINWVLNQEPSQVNWYNITADRYKIKMGDEELPGAEVSNVTSYIPVDVTGLEPDCVWNTKNLVFLNTSIPHMIETDFSRISVSIQFPLEYKFTESLDKILSKKSKSC